MRLFFLVILFVVAATLTSRAEDWRTTDGNIYKNVTVVKNDDLTVTILDDDGGAKVPLTNLPPEIQKRFNFDPSKAKAAALKLKTEEAANAAALVEEKREISERQAKFNIEEEKSADSELKKENTLKMAEWRKNRLEEIAEKLRQLRIEVTRSYISRSERSDDWDAYMALEREQSKLDQEQQQDERLSKR